MASLHDFTVQAADGAQAALSSYRGRVVLVVNTASRCGFTPQYEGLEALQQAFGSERFSVLAFPCNQFGHQEPGPDAEIQTFCATRFAVSFPVFARIEVNGVEEAPVYTFLKGERPGLLGTRAIKWNFTKFLVDGNGRVRSRHAPVVKPEALRAEIAGLIDEG